MGILETIVEKKRDEIKALHTLPLPVGQTRHTPGHILQHLRRTHSSPLGLLCEFKRRSPSAGSLSTKLSLVERVRLYEKEGATAISILTDTSFFGGSFDDLAVASQEVHVPLLCKDFILDRVQLHWAAAHGASLALLIVRMLDTPLLNDLAQTSWRLGLEPLFEVASQNELHTALALGALVIGVNARDLDTLQMDLPKASRVLDAIPPSVVALHLSGVHNPEQMRQLAHGRADGVLVGEALMRQDDPTALLSDLVQGAGSRVSS